MTRLPMRCALLILAIEPKRVDKTIAVVAATYPLKKNVISTDVYAPGFLPN